MVGTRRFPSAAEQRALGALERVMDPEVPVLSITELGIVREVRSSDESQVTVTVTPTYSGCPAMHVIEADIVAALHEAGFSEVRVETVLSPAWTTDWIGEEAREKLREYGIAPPGNTGDELVQIEQSDPVRLSARPPVRLQCPHCGSSDTALVSEFGATACKSLHTCRSCRQPFERFKTF